VQLALIGADLGAVAEPFAVDPRRGEVALDQVRHPPAALPRPGRRPAPLLPPGRQVLLAHQRRDRVLAHPPPGSAHYAACNCQGAIYAQFRQHLSIDFGHAEINSAAKLVRPVRRKAYISGPWQHHKGQI
jgi:hypothetical protein